MKVIIISDIHGNLDALNKALEYIDKREGDKCVVCLGDIVGYSPDPAECFNLVTSITDKYVLAITKMLFSIQIMIIKSTCMHVKQSNGQGIY